MSELDADLQRALLFTHGCLLQAFIATHPNPSALKHAFLYNTNQLISGSKNSKPSKAVSALVQMNTAKLLEAFPPDTA